MPRVSAHAAGLDAGRPRRGRDFWSWREAIYTAAAKIGADDLEAIAARCYLDLLRGGYTGVAEFLDPHRLRRGSTAPLDADVAIARAAARVGIRPTLLPTLYQHSNFGRAAPTPAQAPFIRPPGSSCRTLANCGAADRGRETVLGVAFHSLRAVDVETIAEVCAQLAATDACAVTHIHVAEQPAEVSACREHYGTSPVALLAERGLLGPRWALVHGTHTTPGGAGADRRQRCNAGAVSDHGG